MKNLWQKLKEFALKIWHGLTVTGRVIAGAILVGLLILVAYTASKNEDKNNDNDGPEVAQVYEPSIGSPLPPDVNTESATNSTKITAQVGGASTTEPSNNSAENKTAEEKMVSTNNTDFKVAPKTGINPNDPIQYQNDELRFAVALPAGTKVSEENGQVTFTSSNGSLLYTVSTNSIDSLSNVRAQLQRSPAVANITDTKFANSSALQFIAQGYGSGLVFIANGKTYYLLGNKSLFSSLKTI